MPEITYPCTAIEPGPWLIDSDTLKELDELLQEEWQRLDAYRAELLEEALHDYEGSTEHGRARLEQMHPFRERKRNVSVTLKNGTTIAGQSCQEIGREHSILNDIPVGLNVDLQCAGITASLTVKKDAAIHVSPSTQQVARELFTRLRQWALRNSTPTWQRWWISLTGFGIHWSIALMVVLIGFGTLFDTDRQNKAQAKKLLADGLSGDEQTRAIETLLRLGANIAPSDSEPPDSAPLVVISVVLLLVAIALSFRPKTIVGLGRGQTSIQRWRFYIKWLFYTAPTLVFGSFVWPYFVGFIQRVFQ